MRSNRSSGQPLPTVWRTLTDATAVFRRPQLVLIASAPGVGKSALALNLAIKSGASCIYFSADSGPGTQLVRSVSILTGRATGEVQRAMERGYAFEKELEPISRIWWEFDAGPSLDLIDKCVTAHGYLGAYPDICVIDNLMNVDPGEEGSEAKAHKDILLFGLELARKRNMCVIVLAHLVGEYEDGVTPPPLSALMNKIGKIPELILCPYREETPYGEAMGISIPKNRDGIANAAGTYTVSLKMDLNRMAIEDHPSGVQMQAV
ncbi:DnaB-like helicase C-terminal domain-containing protein [Actinomadura oligospora]|uniref:DnaB-like helicase C-terminal domain-containing protein n=1 Tax=Actinomadura oligospora TaxID=111804 RepID=UPI001FE1FB14|nr:DnaB-like helicase C-terminal domain-containing protein [Actinomadura oligospora]